MADKKYRKKLIRISVLLLLGIIVVFQLSVKPTLKLRKDIKTIERESGKKQEIQTQLNQLEQKQVQVNSYFLNTSESKEKEVQTWNFIVKQSDSLALFLANYPEIHHTTGNSEFSILSQEVGVRGDYIDMVKFIHAIEQNNELFVHSASFRLETNRKTAEKYLTGKLYLQQIVKNNQQ